MYYEEIICKGKKYQIQEGDTLYKISRREEVPLEWILQANPYINVYNLQIGDWICIPKQSKQEEGMEGKSSCHSAAQPRSDMAMIEYVVGEGDTLETLLERFGTDLEELLKYNGLNAVALRKGCVLKVPKEVEDI